MEQMEERVSVPSAEIGPRRASRGAVASLAAAALCVLLAVPQTGFGGTNLDDGVYPDPQCGSKPEVPKRPEKLRFRAELDAYNVEYLTPPLTARDILLGGLSVTVGAPDHPLLKQLGSAWTLLESLSDPKHSYALCDACDLYY